MKLLCMGWLKPKNEQPGEDGDFTLKVLETNVVSPSQVGFRFAATRRPGFTELWFNIYSQARELIFSFNVWRGDEETPSTNTLEHYLYLNTDGLPEQKYLVTHTAPAVAPGQAEETNAVEVNVR